ncbi:PspC domain-containing protein [Bacteroides pyogenes]|nr:PspC domain-containing protein [Bacteroides pyogenes]MBB3895859.1 phage shock protein PspC (stress-responsive transcriptional regulator) [Bacteroides pyogenes]MBR8705821.1 hypothetical protein [Bacteroides pyogenes]MBR8708569.1 hypothetical protein [Bacteroides pyogenes]MBR8717167.1 hypothetical protein [Bacteroides pyogenes]MBR8747686.1 hypothetical protein [Bacteroides pyogenes]
MKKTLTVNLGGTVYHIDEDAYRLLDNYLNNLRLHFRKQQGANEIVDDMENRISELFSERISLSKQVITVSDVEEVIARMGKPEDLADAESGDEPGENPKEKGKRQNNDRSGGSRRCFRDPDNKMLGGVAAGLAAYLGWDVTVVRLLMIALIFLPYFPMVIIYLVCWLLIPEARTAAEKLSMRGEAVTVENIGKTVTDGFERMADGVNNYMRSDKPRTLLQKIGDAFVAVVGFILKLFLIALLIVCFPVLFVLAILFVALVIAIISIAIGGGALLLEWIPTINWEPLASISPIMTVVGTMGGVLFIGIPLVGLAYSILRQLFHWQPMGSVLKWSLFILWVTGLVLCIINLSALGWQLPLYGLHRV